jgi:hypothetical protein
MDLWARAIGMVEAKWRHALFGPAGQVMLLTVALMAMELFLLNWERPRCFAYSSSAVRRRSRTAALRW